MGHEFVFVLECSVYSIKEAISRQSKGRTRNQILNEKPYVNKATTSVHSTKEMKKSIGTILYFIHYLEMNVRQAFR